MLVKLLYSALLAVVALAAAGELLRVWTDQRLYIGAFEVAAAGAGGEGGAAFAAQVGLAHALIFHQLQEYNQRGIGGTSDTTYNIAPDEQARVFENKFADLALTYQDVNIGQLLSSLRKSLAQPNEVSGAVTELGGQSWARVIWPRAPAVGGKAESAFLTDTRPDLPGSVHQVACSIAWAQVASDKADGNKAAIAAMGRSRFCRWSEALDVYSRLLAKKQDVALAAIAPWRSELKAMADAGVRFSDIFRLRADFTDLLAPGERRPLLPEAQDDRLQYALLTDPEIQKLPPDVRRLHAFGLARPALALEAGKLGGLRDNWRSVLEPYAKSIARSAAAVGSLRRGDASIGRSTAFRIRSDLVMTVRYALAPVLDDVPVQVPDATDPPDPRTAGLSFCEADSAVGHCPPEKRFAVTGVVVDGGPDSFIVVLRIEQRGPADFLLLRDTSAAREDLIDQYAYIVGYPYHDTRVPPVLLETLLGNTPGIKRLLPGRTLGFVPEPRPPPKAPVFTTDISTLGGTGGGPLVDLVSGRVIGVHFAGEWIDEKGKFSSSELITPELVKTIEEALKPAPDGPGVQPVDAPAPALH